MDLNDLDLTNPIFTIYINVSGLTPQKVDDSITSIKKLFNYNNITIWIITTTGETKIECVYDALNKQRSSELSNLIKEINKKVEILSDCKNFDDFKIKIRDWRLENLLDEKA